MRFKLGDRLFYGWVLVGAFLILSSTIFGIRFSFGVFFKSIEGEFNLTRAATSTIFSLSMILGCLFAVIGGWALDRYGPRIVVLVLGLFTGLSLLLTGLTNSLWQLFITYSLLLSVGTGAAATVLISTVSRWFDRKRGLALGIATSGAGLGPVVLAPFAAYLISSTDWRMAFIIIGLIAWALIIPVSRLLKKDPREIGVLPDGVKSHPPEVKTEVTSIQPADLSLRQAFRTRSFWLFVFIWVFFGANLFLVLTHLVPHATDMGFSPTEAASVLSLAGGASIFGRLLLGTASDRIGRKLTGVICNLLHAGAMVTLLWAQDLLMLYLFALLFGLAWGGFGTSMSALIGDTFGVSKIGFIFGATEAGFGIGAALGPVLGGLAFDIRGSYFLAFLVGAVAMLLVSVLIVLIRRETGRLPAGSS